MSLRSLILMAVPSIVAAATISPMDVEMIDLTKRTPSGSTSGGPDYDTILKAHGIIMTIVFVGLYPLGSILMPLLGRWWAHASFQTIAFLMMWAGFALGYVYAEYDGYLWRTHPLVGTICVSLLGLQPFLGFLHHRHFRTHQKRGLISYVHIWYGRALMILGIINGGLGLQMSGYTGGTYVIAYSVVAAIMFAAYVAVVVLGLFRKKPETTASFEKRASAEHSP